MNDAPSAGAKMLLSKDQSVTVNITEAASSPESLSGAGEIPTAGGHVYLAHFDGYLARALVQAFERVGYSVIGPLSWPKANTIEVRGSLAGSAQDEAIEKDSPTRKDCVQIGTEEVLPSLDQIQPTPNTDDLHHFGPLDADVVVMLLPQHEAEAKALARELSRSPSGRKRVFVAVSSLLSWARTTWEKGVEGGAGGGLTVADEPHRKPHPRAMQLVEAERYITRCDMPGVLRTALVWGGVPFGLGESLFLPLFQGAFGESGKVPCYGNGSNRVPTIHVADLAAYIVGVAVSELEGQLFFAVDLANAPLRTICEAVAKEVDGAEVVTADADEVLERGGDWPLLLLNLPLQPTPLPPPFLDFGTYQFGMALSMPRVLAEYREARVRPPLRILITGPPASGKTTLAALLAQTYYVPHLTSKAIISFCAAQGLDEELKQSARASICESPQTAAAHPRGRAGAAAMRERPRLSDEVLARMWHQYLLSERRFAEKGFIMDGFPRNLSQATTVFYQPKAVPPPPQPVLKPSATITERSQPVLKPSTTTTERNKPSTTTTDKNSRGSSAASTRPNSKGSIEGKLEGVKEDLAKVEDKLVVQWAINLEARDALLAARVAAIPPEQATGTHNTPPEFARRMKAFRSLQPQQPALFDMLSTLGAKLIPLDIGDEQPAEPLRAGMEEGEDDEGQPLPHSPEPPLLGYPAPVLVENLRATIGPPERYASYVAPLAGDESRATSPETSEEPLETEEERASREAEEQRLADVARAQEQERAQQARWQEQENGKLMELSQPLYDWLMDAVMPSVLDAMLTVAKSQPKNAMHALSRFLKKKAKELEAIARKVAEEEEKEAAEALRIVEEEEERGEETVEDGEGGTENTEDVEVVEGHHMDEDVAITPTPPDGVSD